MVNKTVKHLRKVKETNKNHQKSQKKHIVKRSSEHKRVITKFIENMFSLQMTLKMVHWSTKSFAVHKATDDSMAKILPLIDSFVESFLGKKHYSLQQHIVDNVKIEKIKTSSDLKSYVAKIVKYLISLNKYINNDEHSDLVSIRDSILSELNVLKYLLDLQ